MSVAWLLFASHAAAQKPGSARAPSKISTLYRARCQPCHGPGGKAASKPLSFVDGEWKHGSGTNDVIRIITDGVRGTAMKPFKRTLTTDQIAELARLVRSFDKTLTP